MNLEHIQTLFDREQRREVMFYNMRREVTPYVVRHISLPAGSNENFVIHSRLTADNADAVIRQETAYFDSLGRGFEWKVYGYDSPPDLLARLRAFGFEIDEEEAVLVLDVNQAPPALLQPVSHTVRRLTSPAGVEDAVAVQRQVWPDKRFIDHLADRLARQLQHDPTHLSLYVAYAGREPVSSAWITFHTGSGFAGLWGGSTVKAYRNRGFYTALVAARLQEARRRGVRYLTIDAGPMSRPILQKFGFQQLTTARACLWPAAGAGR